MLSSIIALLIITIPTSLCLWGARYFQHRYTPNDTEEEDEVFGHIGDGWGDRDDV